MKCGFYELDITPALGSIIPGDFKARFATKILDRLYVRAFAAVNDTEAIALVSVDACGITLDITQRIRARVAEYTPLKPENVMVVATHCHGGGPTLNWGEEVVTDPAYLTNLVNKAADAITMAYQNAEEMQMISGREELSGYSFVRDYRMKDGTLKTNPSAKMPELIDCPTTTVDPEVLVLAAKNEAGFAGALISYANHPAIVANKSISGDYISELSRALKKVYGPEFVAVFVNGACGNINHLNPFDAETRAPGRERVIGRALAEKVQSAITSGTAMNNTDLAAGDKTITVRFRKPDEAALLSARKVFEELGDSLVESVPGSSDYRKTFYALQAFRIMADKRTQRELELQLLKIGDTYVAGTPTQMFVQYGKNIKAGIAGNCFVSIFANDYCGYVPTPDCIGEPGIYEARLCPTSALEPATGDLVVKGILDLYKKMN